MSDPSVPGTPTPEEAAELLLNPDLSTPGLMVVDGKALPSDEQLGRKVLTKITMPGGYVKKDVLTPRVVVVVDKSHPSRIPDILKGEGRSDERTEWIENLNRDIFVNLLSTPSNEEFGAMVRETLIHDEECYDPETKEMVPGYYDPADDDTPHFGEQRRFVVITGS